MSISYLLMLLTLPPRNVRFDGSLTRSASADQVISVETAHFRDPSAGEPTASAERSTRDLTEAERAAIKEALSEYWPVRWIEDPDEWRTKDLRPTIEGAVILGVGEPIVQDDTGLVPVSLWCGGTCGTWFTYRLDLIDSSWVVTGIEGTIAIS